MTGPTVPAPPVPPAGHPYPAEIEAERRGWAELLGLVRSLTADEWLQPGYYTDPDWTVRDLVAHVGTWLAEAQIQFARMSAGSYGGHDIDVDALNATMLNAMSGQPWEVAYVQANAGRTLMLDEWYRLTERNDEAAWWIRKSASDHYHEHLPRLRQWVPALVARRSQ
jgi:Mycothiol maleylpyruvate isomerase N-terminal domain